jgi:hypothetical protein
MTTPLDIPSICVQTTSIMKNHLLWLRAKKMTGRRSRRKKVDDSGIGDASRRQDSHMTAAEGADRERYSDLEIVNYLWVEYQYRHDMVWRLVFRVTSVATLLMIAPFLADEVTRHALGNGLLFLPAIAVIVVMLGLWSLSPELRLLDKVKVSYRHVQDYVMCSVPRAKWEPHDRHDRSPRFRERVQAFLVVILLATVLYLILFWQLWLPNLKSK